MNLSEIEKLTQEFQASRTVLIEDVAALQSVISKAKKAYLPHIRKSAERAADKHRELQEAIEASPALFQKPKTVIFHGVRVGFMKGKGEITWEDTAQVVKLIKKNFPDQVDVLIKVSESPVKTALAQLSVADLKKLGVTVTETDDQVVIKPTDSEIDKIVNAILKEDEVREAA